MRYEVRVHEHDGGETIHRHDKMAEAVVVAALVAGAPETDYVHIHDLKEGCTLLVKQEGK